MAYPGQQQNANHTHMHMPPYNDHILTITEKSCADPYVVWDNGVYYMTFTTGGGVDIWSSDSLFDFEKRCRKDVIWTPPPNTPYSGDIWAPEIHIIQGQWWAYFAADDPAHGNKSHRMYVLEGPPASQSPCDRSKWTFHGALAGMPPNQWAIDGTVLTLHGGLCFVYSGWPLNSANPADESKQELYLIEMLGPTACTGAPILISTPTHAWEFSGRSGINEGPQILSSPDGRWLGIAYSCAGSWTSEYKMGVLEFRGGSPLDSRNWVKWGRPLLEASKDGKAPYGPGHGNFVGVSGPGGREVWGVFHATDRRTGWEGRRARVMRVGWGPNGPYMGSGECGGCCEDVNHFLHGAPLGACGGHTGGGGGGQIDYKKELKGLVGEAKGLLKRFTK
ncbi:Arabinanase/levansucrase/invertase [Polyplosphaeria fusca]|uniref:Arabinanase/levansucrase/invertase n=1 Tax=Polyplosphaeria fusca TaxID=682080 RepID=A0A9P4QVM8_9PLEO|nr:Arabinanase/levansucrase/invertase [Polyplosphaeria fusca]